MSEVQDRNQIAATAHSALFYSGVTGFYLVHARAAYRFSSSADRIQTTSRHPRRPSRAWCPRRGWQLGARERLPGNRARHDLNFRIERGLIITSDKRGDRLQSLSFGGGRCKMSEEKLASFATKQTDPDGLCTFASLTPNSTHFPSSFTSIVSKLMVQVRSRNSLMLHL